MLFEKERHETLTQSLWDENVVQAEAMGDKYQSLVLALSPAPLFPGQSR